MLRTAPPALDTLVTVPPDDVFGVCGTTPAGLSGLEAEQRLATFGPNRIEAGRTAPWWQQLIANYTHTMALLLWVGGATAFAAGLPQMGVAVWSVNVLNGMFSSWQEHKAERATEALQQLLPMRARVIRDGQELAIAAQDLVPGDLMVLEEGDRICADGRLVAATELRIDQSTLTGESRPARRDAAALPDGAGTPPVERRNWVFAGTAVSSGRGRAVVTATGMSSEFGGLASLTQSIPHDRSPLQRELERVSKVVGAIAVAAGVTFFLVAQLLTPMEAGQGFVFALGMIVAFVPEGLLPTVTLALAMGTQRMARRQALVRRLASVEALGCTTVICTDKTGTLTENQMTVREVWLPEGSAELTGDGYDPAGRLFLGAGSDRTAVEALLSAAALVNNARLVPPEDPSGPGWTIRGDPTEGALLVAAAKAGIDLDALAEARPRIGEIPFDSERRRMSTVHAVADGAALYLKGGPIEVLDRCASIRTASGVEPMDDRWRSLVRAADERFAGDALRVLAVAERHWPDVPAIERSSALEDDLVFLGLVAMLDPPRPEVASAIATCRRAGIRVVMMTGDQGATAVGIARRVGLARPDAPPCVVEGAELDTLDDAALREVLDGDVVLARTTPANKLRVVEALQAAGHVVAVTGDGVNDAPALKRADVGIAMGRSGTDVARQAADVVLLDDNFATIVAAVEEGRSVFANIRKFSGYIFSSNAPEALPFIVFGLTGGRVPPALDVMHILAVDLGTDLLPALALGAEPPEPGLMERPPRPRDEHVIDRSVLARSYLWIGPVQALVVMAAFYLRYWIDGYSGHWLDLPDSGTLYASATGVALAAVVATQIGNLLAHRSERTSFRRIGFGGNALLWWGVAFELAVITLIVYAPPLQSLIGTAAFPWWIWLVLATTAPVPLAIDELRKRRLRGRSEPARADRAA